MYSISLGTQLFLEVKISFNFFLSYLTILNLPQLSLTIYLSAPLLPSTPSPFIPSPTFPPLLGQKKGEVEKERGIIRSG